MHKNSKRWLILPFVFLVTFAGAFVITSQATSAETSVDLPWQNPPDYNIVYLVGPTELFLNSNASPSMLEQALGANITRSWNDVTSDNGIDALVIHDSALPLVNQEQLAALYRQGVLISFMNLYAPEVAQLVDDPCIAKDGFASEEYSGEFYVMVYKSIKGQPEDIARYWATPDSCGETIEGIDNPLSIRSGRATESMEGTDGFNIFANVLVSKLENR